MASFDGIRGPAMVRGAGIFALVVRRSDGQADGLFYRLSDTGSPLGPPTILATPDPIGFDSSSVVWTGSEFAVVWYERSLGRVTGRRLSADGSILGTLVDLPATTQDHAGGPGLAWNGLEYGLLYIDEGSPGVSRLRLARLDAGGAVLGTPAVVAQGHPQAARLAAAAGVFGAAWTETDALDQPHVHFRVLGADGVPIGEDPFDLHPDNIASYPEVAAAGDRFAVGWAFDQGLRVAFVTAAATLDGGIVHVTENSYTLGASLSWTGSELMVVWTDWEQDQDLHARSLGADGTFPGAERRLTFGGDTLGPGGVVWTGDRFGLAWAAPLGTGDEARFDLMACGCADADGDQHTLCNGDCDDSDPSVHPGAAETCNGADDDCDGAADEGLDQEVSCGEGICAVL
ncbi:MAG TPA: putative metal-binding motif-containing protein, partial [Candidatus Polarisedimenticolia bacterium]|nr:putative metal-binding motif-containing protein [Candidatus Polarisedimenticolia bacterium]